MLRQFGLSLSFLLASQFTVAAVQERPDDILRASAKEIIRQTDSFKDQFEAEVWLVDMSARLGKWMPDEQQRMKLLKLVHNEASRTGLDPQIVLAVIHVESGFQRTAISSAGAQGFMQVMPFWKYEIGYANDDLTSLETNIKYGCSILAAYLKQDNGNLRLALSRYNGSYGQTWYPELVIGAWKNHWKVH